MDKNLKKLGATDYYHCIIKEELIISDDEKDDSVRVKMEPIDESFMDTDMKENKYDITIDKKPKATGKAAFTSDNIEALYESLTKSYCHKCNVKRAVIRRKARCHECNTQLTYSCEACQKNYNNFTDLGVHLKRRHTVNRQTHPCPVCNKTFAFRQSMMDHRRNHHDSYIDSFTGEQRCAKCGKIFASKHIRKHEKVCDAEPPLKCDKCSYATTYQSNLRKHVHNKHSDFKKECENCNKTFKNLKSMRRHVRVYCNKAKRFECHHCGHKVYRKDELLVHLNQAHFGGSLTGKLVNDSRIPRICKFCYKSLEPFERMKYHLRGCESAPLQFRRPSSPVDGNDKSDRTCKYCGLRLKRPNT